MSKLAGLLPAHTSSAEETFEIGREIGRSLLPGDVVALYGDLGSGKTVLTKGIGAALGIDEAAVSSPTFTLLHEYASGSIPLYHFDAYRIDSPEEFFDLGYEDYFFGDGISVVEWADKVEPLLPERSVRLRMENAGGDRRRILMDASEAA